MTKPVPDNGHSLAMKIANERPMKKSDDPTDNVSGGFNQKAGKPAKEPATRKPAAHLDT